MILAYTALELFGCSWNSWRLHRFLGVGSLFDSTVRYTEFLWCVVNCHEQLIQHPPWSSPTHVKHEGSDALIIWNNYRLNHSKGSGSASTHSSWGRRTEEGALPLQPEDSATVGIGLQRDPEKKEIWVTAGESVYTCCDQESPNRSRRSGSGSREFEE